MKQLPDATAQKVREALSQRLIAAMSILDPISTDVVDRTPGSASDTAALLLLAAVHHVRRNGLEAAWLVALAVSGRYPHEDEVLRLHRAARTDPSLVVAVDLITRSLESPSSAVMTRIRSVPGMTVVDVHFSATSLHNTGIQRVARNLAPQLASHTEVILAAWTADDEGLRELSAPERNRLDGASPAPPSAPDELLVPWGGRLLLTEVPDVQRSPALAALARFSMISVSVVGYDAIPIVSRELVNRREAVKFAAYLSVVKWARSVLAISSAAAEEFQGFVDMLASQGLVGPTVTACVLPETTVVVESRVARRRPLVVVVGSKEPRKNHVAVLVAAEELWRDGLDFELRFIGSPGWDTRRFRRWLARVTAAGRPVFAPTRSDDDALQRAYRDARFTVFPSLHEGYGLPVVESLAHGTPVITTGYGSTGEIARSGGCLVVDPRRDEDIREAMRTLLTSDVALEDLRVQIAHRPVGSWDDYALRVWAGMGAAHE